MSACGGTHAPASRQPLILDPIAMPGLTQTPAGDLKSLLTHDIDGQLEFHRVGARRQRKRVEQTSKCWPHRTCKPSMSDEITSFGSQVKPAKVRII